MIKNMFRRKDRFAFLLPFLAVFFLVCCQKEPTITFGNNFVQNNNNSLIVVVDTVSVDLSTIFIDSAASAGTGTALIGNYNDNDLGYISSRSFFQVTPFAVPSITNQAGYDSIALIMRINKSFYGDTTLPVGFKVNQLQTTILHPYQQYTFYTNSSFPTDPTYLGSIGNVTVIPTGGYTSLFENDTIRIKMSDALGNELFTMLRNQSDTVKNSQTFINYFKGLCVSALNPAPAALYGFRDTMVMRIYYHEPTLITTNKFADFKLNNRPLQFNNVTVDRSATPLQYLIKPTGTVQTPPETPSALTGNNAYLQPLTGLKIKISFPYLRNLLARPDFLSVLRAELIIKPKKGSYNIGNYRLPAVLNLNVTDLNNLIGGALTLNGVTQTGNLTIDYLNAGNTSYSYDISGYIGQQIGLIGPNDNGLILNMPSPANDTTLNRLVLPDRVQAAVNDRVSLKLYYTSLKQN